MPWIGSELKHEGQSKGASSTEQNNQAGFGLKQRALIEETSEAITHLGDLLVP